MTPEISHQTDKSIERKDLKQKNFEAEIAKIRLLICPCHALNRTEVQSKNTGFTVIVFIMPEYVELFPNAINQLTDRSFEFPISDRNS